MEEDSYKQIFKSTFLFGFVQVFHIVTKALTNKAVAILIGPSGMGIIGLFNSSIGMIRTGAGLGISQSAVRDVSEAKGSNNVDRFSLIISITNKIILFTSVMGVLLTVILSPLLSRRAFGNGDYTLSFIALSVVVGLSVYTDGQLAILKGMRQLRSLAKASMWGSFIGMIVSLPLYYIMGEDGIVPSLIVAAFIAFSFSSFYVRKINFKKQKLKIKDIFAGAKPMIIMGSALMLASFLSYTADLIVSSYIRSVGGIEEVGLMAAGTTIMTGYFGILIKALTTDYYPRISAVNHDNTKLQKELNNQATVSLLLCCPLVVLFLLLLPQFIQLLYSKDFLAIEGFVKIGMIGTLITIVSNQVDMILVAKQKTKIFTLIAIVYRILQVIIGIVLYSQWGLIGMGVTLALLGSIHMSIMGAIVYKWYGIVFKRSFLKIALIVFLFTIVTIWISGIDALLMRYLVGAIIFLISTWYSFYISKYQLSINLITLIRRKKK